LKSIAEAAHLKTKFRPIGRSQPELARIIRCLGHDRKEATPARGTMSNPRLVVWIAREQRKAVAGSEIMEESFSLEDRL